MTKVNRVVLVGTGFVGSSYAFSLANQAITEELVLIDVNEEKAKGEAMDINHGQIFYPSPTKIWQGDYSDCKDADIVCITAGISQDQEETRLSGIEKNAAIAKTIVESVMDAGFDGIFLISSNPVDIITYAVWKYSGLPTHRVIGSGTLLDTARYQHELSEYFNVDPRSISGYVIGEHGDSQVGVTSSIRIGGQPISSILKSHDEYKREDLEKIATDVRDVADVIIDYKHSTYYGIGAALARLTQAILRNENVVLPISAYLEGHYGFEDVYVGVPAIINRNGINEIVEIDLEKDEREKFNESVKVIRHYQDQLF